jgi:hypothetical protein
MNAFVAADWQAPKAIGELLLVVLERYGITDIPLNQRHSALTQPSPTWAPDNVVVPKASAARRKQLPRARQGRRKA